MPISFSLSISVSLSLWRSRTQITSPIFRFYQTAHITCFHHSLPLKHCDNAEVDKATCTASSASTSLQTESIQDNGKLECLISWSVLIYIFSRFLEWLICCVGKMLWIWLKFENQLSISVEENVVACVRACVHVCLDSLFKESLLFLFFKQRLPVALWEKALTVNVPGLSWNPRQNHDPGIPLGSR